MGVLRGLIRTTTFIVTAGGSERLRMAKEAYAEKHARHTAAVTQLRTLKSEINVDVVAVGKRLHDVRKSLKVARKLLGAQIGALGDFPLIEVRSGARYAAELDTRFSAEVAAGSGAAAGGVMALGSWALVSTFGADSTGTAISGLSGVALTNATLAWFGGGALAAGGAGMAGGVAVLGGIVALPMVVFAAYSTHSKSKELEMETERLSDEIFDIKAEITRLEPDARDVALWRQAIERHISAFEADVDHQRRTIRPWGVLSLVKQKFLSTVGKPALTRNQVAAFSLLSTAVEKFSAGFGVDASECTKPLGSSALLEMKGDST